MHFIQFIDANKCFQKTVIICIANKIVKIKNACFITPIQTWILSQFLSFPFTFLK